jgi:hypothetical protein
MGETIKIHNYSFNDSERFCILEPVAPDYNQGAEIGGIIVQSQSQGNSSQDPSSKKVITKKVLVE